MKDFVTVLLKSGDVELDFAYEFILNKSLDVWP